jgi:hypothetical protein
MVYEPDPWQGLGVEGAYELMISFVLLSVDSSRRNMIEEKGLDGVRRIAIDAVRFARANEPNAAQLRALEEMEENLSSDALDLDAVGLAVQTFLQSA